MRRRSNSRSAASFAGGARSTGRSRSTRACASREASSLHDKAAFALALDYLSAGLMDRAERLLEELSASREYRRAALDHLVRIYESQGDWANALKIFHALPQAVQVERRRVAAHYLCELAEQALVQGDAERARTLLRQARTHQADLPRADVLTARITELAGSTAGALALYLKALEESPELALEIIPRVLGLWGYAGRRGRAGGDRAAAAPQRHHQLQAARVAARDGAAAAGGAPPARHRGRGGRGDRVGGGCPLARGAADAHRRHAAGAISARTAACSASAGTGAAPNAAPGTACGRRSSSGRRRARRGRSAVTAGMASCEVLRYTWPQATDCRGREPMRMTPKSVIRTAVFPVAGRGTRFLPATKASPKEMLPVVDKPLIQYAVEEALAAGATRLVFVTGASKRAIEDHFDSDQELEQHARAAGQERPARTSCAACCRPMPPASTSASRRRSGSGTRCCARSRPWARSRSSCTSRTTSSRATWLASRRWPRSTSQAR